MGKKNKADDRGYVYSTDPGFSFLSGDEPADTPAPGIQQLRVMLDSRNRGGKAVTLVTGFVGRTADLEALGRSLKSYCGTGGSVKDRDILIQGDQREKVLQWLLQKGYARTKRSGG